MLLKATPTATDLQPGDLLVLSKPSVPGVTNALPYVGVGVVAWQVLRFVGGRYHLWTGTGIRTLSVAEIERGVAEGLWEIEERS